jgi:hypothetical protein
MNYSVEFFIVIQLLIAPTEGVARSKEGSDIDLVLRVSHYPEPRGFENRSILEG